MRLLVFISRLCGVEVLIYCWNVSRDARFSSPCRDGGRVSFDTRSSPTWYATSDYSCIEIFLKSACYVSGLSLFVRFRDQSSVTAESIYRVLLGRSLVFPLAEFLRLLFLNSLTATTSLKSLLNEFSFYTGLREVVGTLPEMKELEACRGALFEFFFCTVVRLLFFASTAGT